MAALIAALAAALIATAVPGIFIVDENHYLVTITALRDAALTVPGTAPLTPSRELHWFDPAGARAVARTPVPPTVPPLYAPIALPFAAFGWRGLVAINSLCFATLAVLIYRITRSFATRPLTPWLATAAFVLGGYSIEYAQGMWPHMLAALLTFGAVALALSGRGRDRGAYFMLAGIAAGLAAGIRYQNIVFAFGVGLGVWLLGRGRPHWKPALLFALGVALPLLASSAINAQRLGSWNPISKGPRYLALPRQPSHELGRIAEVAVMAWARVVDFSARPPIDTPDTDVFIRRDSATGGYLYEGTAKKAWLQSSPWVVLALAHLALAWLPRREPGSAARLESRSLGLVVFGVLLLFAAVGARRHDGLCFNQRYFLELVPLVAVAFGWSLDRFRLSVRHLGVGLAAGFAIASIWIVSPLTTASHLRVVLWTPLVVAGACLAAWIWARRDGKGTATVLAFSVGIALAWSFAVHLHEDVAASNARRSRNLQLARDYDQLLPRAPERIALFTYWGSKDAIGPLLLERNLVVADAHYDAGETMPLLLRELLADGRRVFVNTSDFADEQLRAAFGGMDLRHSRSRSLSLIEVVGEPPPGR